ncbi:hypothetical protein ABPG75_009222 [Micractinium tetrahymenae]
MSRRNLVAYAKALVKAGLMEEPAWMAALARTPPLPPGKPGKRPPRIVYPEDALVENYYRKHPEARLEPVDLSSFEPPTARRFALRQLELMHGRGLSQRRAYEITEKEFAEERRQREAAAGGQRASIIDQIQAEEEFHLQQAMRTYSDRNGPHLVKQHARELWQASHPGGAASAARIAAARAAQQQQRQAAAARAAKKQQAAGAPQQQQQQQKPAAAKAAS